MGSLSIWHWLIVFVVVIPLVLIIIRSSVRGLRSKTCPKCAERVKAAALVCRFCGYKFAPEESLS